MLTTCVNVAHMSKMIQIRNVPDHVHRELRRRALDEGISLSDYLLRLAEADIERPTIAEFLERTSKLPPFGAPGSAAALIREDRDQ